MEEARRTEGDYGGTDIAIGNDLYPEYVRDRTPESGGDRSVSQDTSPNEGRRESLQVCPVEARDEDLRGMHWATCDVL